MEDRQKRRNDLIEKAKRLLPQIAGVALVPVSGLTGEGVDKLMEAILAAHATWNKRVSTAKLNRWLTDVLERHPPPAVSGRRIKLRYLTQSKARPPTFAAFTRTDDLTERTRRQLMNAIRREFNFAGVPIRILVRPSREHEKKRKKPAKRAATAS